MISDGLTPISAFRKIDKGQTCCLFESVVGGDFFTRCSWSRRWYDLRRDEYEKFAFAESVLPESKQLADVLAILQVRNARSVKNFRSLAQTAQYERFSVVNSHGRLGFSTVDNGLFIGFGEAAGRVAPAVEG